MSLNPAISYPGQISTLDPTGYPYGRPKNLTAIGDGSGTPLEQGWLSDLFGFEQALLVEGKIVPSGTPDKVGASQYLDALKAIILAAQPGAAFNHAALRKWSRSVTDVGSGAVWSQVVGMQPVRSFDTNGERQRMPLLLGPSGGTRLVAALSNDGSVFETPRTLNAGQPFTPTAAAACKPGECIAVDGSTAVAQYTTNHGNSFTVVTTAFPGAAVHYVAASGVYLYLDSHGNFSRGTSLASLGSWTNIALGITAADPAISEFADDGGLNVVLVSRVSGHGFASIYRSGDGGITWTFVQNFVGFFANVAYSKALGRFFVWDDAGTMQTSTNGGAAWTSIASGLYTSHGFMAGAKTLACVGSAVVKVWRYTPSANFTQRGITYSLDGALTWNSYAFGEVPVGGSEISQVRTIDNRLYAVDSVGLWSCGELHGPASEF